MFLGQPHERSGPENHKCPLVEIHRNSIGNSTGAPPELLRFLANERRAPILANDGHAFHWLEAALDAHWPKTGGAPVDFHRGDL